MSDATRPVSMFDASYAGTPPPWDIGHAQPAFVTLTNAGEIQGSALDVGCGTGEHVLFLRTRGHEAWGVDASPGAIAKAEDKAIARGIDDAVFRVGDALTLGALGRTFDTVIDSGVFHVFSDEDQARYARSLASVLREGGAYFALVFSDREPTKWGGPRRVAKKDFARAFAEGWRVAWIRAERFETNVEAHRAIGGAQAWLAKIERA